MSWDPLNFLTLILMRITGLCCLLLVFVVAFDLWEVPKFSQICFLLWIAWFGLMGRPTNE